MRPSSAQIRDDQSEPLGWTSAVLPVVVGGLVIGAVGLWAALAKLANPSPALVVRYVVVGLAYLGVGWLLAERGFGRLGLLVALTGALWFVNEIQTRAAGSWSGSLFSWPTCTASRTPTLCSPIRLAGSALGPPCGWSAPDTS